MDKDDRKLPAIFHRYDDYFKAKPWESVCFDEQEGFELLSWYDPCEVWFNFTFDNSAYNPGKWGKLLWMNEKGSLDDYLPIYLDNIPKKDEWLIHLLSEFSHKIKEIDLLDDVDDDKIIGDMLQNFLERYPRLSRFAELNNRLAPILDNPDILVDAKVVLWCGKVSLDYELRYYLKIDTYDE